MKLITDFSVVNVVIGTVLALILFVTAVLLPMVSKSEKLVYVSAKIVCWTIGSLFVFLLFAWILDANWWFDYLASYTAVTACLLLVTGIVKIFKSSLQAARNSHKLGFIAGAAAMSSASSALTSVSMAMLSRGIAQRGGYYFDDDDVNWTRIARIWYAVFSAIILILAIVSFKFNFAVVDYDGNTVMSSKYGAFCVSEQNFVAVQVDEAGTYVFAEVSAENMNLYKHGLHKVDPYWTNKAMHYGKGNFDFRLSNGARCENTIRNIQIKSNHGQRYLKMVIEKQFSANECLFVGKWDNIIAMK